MVGSVWVCWVCMCVGGGGSGTWRLIIQHACGLYGRRMEYATVPKIVCVLTAWLKVDLWLDKSVGELVNVMYF